jgi:hypothetical protein
MKTNIIHLGEMVFEKKVKRNNKYINLEYPYYKCIKAVGIANPNKVTFDKNKVTCKNCLKWYCK